MWWEEAARTEPVSFCGQKFFEYLLWKLICVSEEEEEEEKEEEDCNCCKLLTSNETSEGDEREKSLKTETGHKHTEEKLKQKHSIIYWVPTLDFGIILVHLMTH